MDWPNDCAAVIPCYQEAGAIADVVRATRVYLPTIVVVDDGSSDGTAEAARAAGARVIRHPRNRGKGAALASGCRYALARRQRWALCLDGDGQHDPREIPAFFVRAAQTQADLLIGNRFHNGDTSMSRLRRTVNLWMSRRLSARAGRCLPDTQCGYRLLRLALWQRLQLATHHFEIESELLLAALAANARIEFVPIRTIRAVGPSKIRPLTDTWRWCRWWWNTRRRPEVGLRQLARPN